MAIGWFAPMKNTMNRLIVDPGTHTHTQHTPRERIEKLAPVNVAVRSTRVARFVLYLKSRIC